MATAIKVEVENLGRLTTGALGRLRIRKLRVNAARECRHDVQVMTSRLGPTRAPVSTQ